MMLIWISHGNKFKKISVRKMKNTHVVDTPLLVRHPLLKLKHLKSTTKNFSNPYHFTKNKPLMLAIKTHSPQLYKKIKEAKNDENKLKKFLPALQKYFLRATTHTIPRGLFAGYEVINSMPEQKNKTLVHEIKTKQNKIYYLLNPSVVFLDRNIISFKTDFTGQWKESKLKVRADLYKGLQKIQKSGECKLFFKNDLFKQLMIPLNDMGSQILQKFVNSGLFTEVNRSYYIPHYKGFRKTSSSFLKKDFSSTVEFETINEISEKFFALSTEQKTDLGLIVQIYIKLFLNTPKRMVNEYLVTDFLTEFNHAIDFDIFTIWLHKKMNSKQTTYFEKKALEQIENTKKMLSLFLNNQHDYKNLIDLKEFMEQLPYPHTSNEPIIGSLFLEKVSAQKVFLEYVLGGSRIKTITRHALYSENARRRAMEVIKEEEELFKSKYYQIIYGQNHPSMLAVNAALLDYKKNIVINSPKLSSEDLSCKDLLVYADGKSFLLINKTTGELIKPFISNLWIWSVSSHLQLKTLCYIASQNELKFESFGTNIFGNHADWPRVEFGSCIVCPRRWYFKISKSNQDPLKLINDKKVPHRFYFITGDRKLFFDLTQKEMGPLFKSLALSRKEFQVEECFMDTQDQPYLYKNIHAFLSKSPIFEKTEMINTKLILKVHQDLKKYKAPHYSSFKIYFDKDRMDDFLKNCPKTKDWFFIRYFDDEGLHLRIRFLNSQTENHADFLHKFTCKLEQFLKEGFISNYNQNHYRPEYLRYGGLQGVELMLKHSCQQSDLVVSLLDSKNWETVQKRRGLLLCFMQSYVESFYPHLNERIRFLESLVYSSKKNDLTLTKEEKLKIYSEMQAILKNKNFIKRKQPFIKNIQNLKNNFDHLQLHNQIDIDRKNFLRDLMHLLVNRFDIKFFPTEHQLNSILLTYNYMP